VRLASERHARAYRRARPDDRSAPAGARREGLGGRRAGLIRTHRGGHARPAGPRPAPQGPGPARCSLGYVDPRLDEQQAWAGTRSTPSPVLSLWKPSTPSTAPQRWMRAVRRGPTKQRVPSPMRAALSRTADGSHKRPGRDSFPPAFPRDAGSSCAAALRPVRRGLENRCPPFGGPWVRIPPPP
jgi:hypothetical protein